MPNRKNSQLIHCTICRRLFLSHVGLVKHLFNHTERGDNVSPGGTEIIQIPDSSPESSDSEYLSPMEIRETEVVQIEVTETIVIERTVEASESRSAGRISSPEMEIVDTTSSSSEEVVGAAAVAAASRRHNFCLLCDRVFLLHSSLEDHLRNFHGVGVSSPEMEAQDATSSSDEAIQAAAPAERQQQHICYVCDMHLPLERCLIDHLRNFHNVGGSSSPEMEVQETTSSSSDEVIEAAASDDPRERYLCTACNQTFYTQLGLEDHMTAIHNVISFCCIYCGEPFLDEELLLTHEMESHGNRPIRRCFTCLKRFITEVGFQNHRCFSEN